MDLPPWEATTLKSDVEVITIQKTSRMKKMLQSASAIKDATADVPRPLNLKLTWTKFLSPNYGNYGGKMPES